MPTSDLLSLIRGVVPHLLHEDELNSQHEPSGSSSLNKSRLSCAQYRIHAPSSPGADRDDQKDTRQETLDVFKPMKESASFFGRGCDVSGDLNSDYETIPLYNLAVASALARKGSLTIFPQYGLLGRHVRKGPREAELNVKDLVFANMNAPWSAFICGAQGAGKSHTLSCLLESSLLLKTSVSECPKPLAGLVFHYDRFSSCSTTQLCEAAYLCSHDIPVRVLVSPSNELAMRNVYHNLPGYPSDAQKPRVLPLYLSEKQLSVATMMALMSVHDTSHPPLYLASVHQVLREMAMEQRDASGIDYADFKIRLSTMGFSKEQNAPLKLRLQLLESFLAHTETAEEHQILEEMWTFNPGTLTIVDLSCPFVKENDACALFNICLSIFMQNRHQCGRIIALDEAHKFLTQSGEAARLTEELVSVIRQQRHLATRVVIATQEPTLSTQLLDLCNVSIIHRFNSPAWYKTLKEHLAGVCGASTPGMADMNLFPQIVGLKTGQAFVFCPTAAYDVKNGIPITSEDNCVKLQIRNRVTADGGRSILASDHHKRTDDTMDTTAIGLRPYSRTTSLMGNAAVPLGHTKQQKPNTTVARGNTKKKKSNTVVPCGNTKQQISKTKIHSNFQAPSSLVFTAVEHHEHNFQQMSLTQYAEGGDAGRSSENNVHSLAQTQASDKSLASPSVANGESSTSRVKVENQLRESAARFLRSHPRHIDHGEIRTHAQEQLGTKGKLWSSVIKRKESNLVINAAVREYCTAYGIEPPKGI